MTDRDCTQFIKVVSRKSWITGAPRMISLVHIRAPSGIERARSIFAPIYRDRASAGSSLSSNERAAASQAVRTRSMTAR